MFGRLSPGIVIALLAGTLIAACLAGVFGFFSGAAVDPPNPPAKQEGLIDKQSVPKK